MLINVKLRHAMKLDEIRIVTRLNYPTHSGMYPSFKPSLVVSNLEVPADLPNPRDGRNFDDWWIGRGGSEQVPWNPVVKIRSVEYKSSFCHILSMGFGDVGDINPRVDHIFPR